MPHPATALDESILGDIFSHLSLADLAHLRTVSTGWRDAAAQEEAYRLAYLTLDAIDPGTRRAAHLKDKALRAAGETGVNWQQLCADHLASEHAWAVGKPVSTVYEDPGFQNASLTRTQDGMRAQITEPILQVDGVRQPQGYSLIEASVGTDMRAGGSGVTEVNFRENLTSRFCSGLGTIMIRLLETGRDDRVQPWYVELWVSAEVWEDFGARERLYFATEWPGLQEDGFLPPMLPPEDAGGFVPNGVHAGFKRLAVFPTPVRQNIYDIHVRVPPGKLGELEVAAAHHSLAVPEEGDLIGLGLHVTVLASTCDWAREGVVEDIALQPPAFNTYERSIVLASEYVFKVWMPSNTVPEAGVHVYSRTSRAFVTALNVHLLSALKTRLSPIYWVSMSGKQFDDIVEPELVQDMEAAGGILELQIEPVTAKLKKTYNLYKVLLHDREPRRPALSSVEVCGTSLCLLRTSGIAFIIHDYAKVFAFAETLPEEQRATFITEQTIILATPRPRDKYCRIEYAWSTDGVRLVLRSVDRTLLFDVASMPRLPAWREPWTPRDPVKFARKAPKLAPLRCRAIVEEVPADVLRRHRLDKFLVSPAGMFTIPSISRLGLPVQVARYEGIERGEYKLGLHRLCFEADGGAE